MRILSAFLFIGVVAVMYYRYRDHFYALEAATDSNKGRAFWTILALVFAAVIAVGYCIFYLL